MGKVKQPGARLYSGFRKIDGSHPYRLAVPDGYVDYAVRTRHCGKVFYFNFDLAKEMGLIPESHPNEFSPELTEAILDAFALQIINEYDIENKILIPEEDIRPNKYMATRYLQLQHPSNKGVTSGDGRSMWNGFFEGKDATWDISSCGTGGTCLSPAVANEQKFFKTGDPDVSYGSGLSDLLDGVCAAVMSDILYRNGIQTERTLAIISFDDDTSINVRASKNLLRPAHFFGYLKQGDYKNLKGGIDFYINRQVKNGDWPEISDEQEKYQDMLTRIAISFAQAAARFEIDYIFCWMDWDGDNILVDAGIIDYGSLRQFGLYHHEYRYDDVERMSTTITEQKNKARYIVQTFAQITDFLITGKKKNIHNFRKHAALKLFDRVFEASKDQWILYKVGFDWPLIDAVLGMKESSAVVRDFRKVYSYFEKTKSKKGLYEIQDGVTWDAVFCIRDILRELPARYLNGQELIAPDEFIEILSSDYAAGEDVALTPGRKRKINEFQRLYHKLLEMAAGVSGQKKSAVLQNIKQRTELINRYERVTGDSIIYLAEALVEGRKRMTAKSLHEMFSVFVEQQILQPEYYSDKASDGNNLTSRNAKKTYDSMLQIVKDYREGI